MSDLDAAMRIGALTRELMFETMDGLFWKAFSWTPEGRAFAERRALDQLHEQIPDPELRAKLTPDYPIGCKRILLTSDFYPTLLRDNVTLETAPIERLTEAGIVSEAPSASSTPSSTRRASRPRVGNGRSTSWARRDSTCGRRGVSGPRLLGMLVPGFPNLFILYGPNTNLGHNSITYMIEQQVSYLLRALTLMEQKGAATVAVTPEAHRRFNQQLQADLARTVWADEHCHSWYKTRSGEITQNWSGSAREYAQTLAEIETGDLVLR